MNAYFFQASREENLETVTLTPGEPPSRVISGTPRATERVLHHTDQVEIGVWEISPGQFHSSKIGVSEFMYFVHGAGTITLDSGEIFTITPGSSLFLPDGSHVVWKVEAPTRKLYLIDQS